MPPKPPHEPAVTRAKFENPLLAGERRIELPRLHIAVERQGTNEKVTTPVQEGDVGGSVPPVPNDIVTADPPVPPSPPRTSRGAGGGPIPDRGPRNGPRLDGVRVI